jgi:ribosomal protein S19
MKRSKWKPFLITKKNQRSRLITPSMVNETISIHNGKDQRSVKITVDHVNHRLGDFSHTKVTPRFKTKRKN